MSVGLILIIVLVVLFFGALPTWGHGLWGYGPSGAIGLLLVVLLILVLLGKV